MAPVSSIAAGIEAIPAKKEALRKAFQDVQAHPSYLVPFTLEWDDLDDHLSSLQRSVESRFRELESREKERSAPAAAGPAKEKERTPDAAVGGGQTERRFDDVESRKEEDSPGAAAAAPSAAVVSRPKRPIREVESREKECSTAAAAATSGGEAEMRPDLRSFCVTMDGRGLRAFIAKKSQHLGSIKEELDRAIRAAADPAGLVLDAMDGFYPAKPVGALGDAALLKNRKACIFLLELLYEISSEIKPLVKERAKQLAADWKDKIPPEGGQERALPFLQLLLSYGIVSEFELDDVFEVLASVVGWKHAVDLCRKLGLSEKMPHFIEKLLNKQKKIEAVKFVYSFGLVDKFPPVQLLKSYLTDVKKVAVQVRRTAKYSKMSQIEAASREIAAHRAVIKAIAEYHLEPEYSPVVLQNRATELEQFKQKLIDQRKSGATSSADMEKSKTLGRKGANKRPRPSTMAASTAAAAHPLAPLPQTHPAVAAQPLAPLQQARPAFAASSFAPLPQTPPMFAAHLHEPQPQTPAVVAAHSLVPPPLTHPLTQPQVPLIDSISYMASNEPYNLSGSGYLYDHTAAAYTMNPVGLGPMRSPPRSSLHSDPSMGSGLYDKSGAYRSYSLSGGYHNQ